MAAEDPMKKGYWKQHSEGLLQTLDLTFHSVHWIEGGNLNLNKLLCPL